MKKTGLLKTLTNSLVIGISVWLVGCSDDKPNHTKNEIQNPSIGFNFIPYFVSLPSNVIMNTYSTYGITVCAIDLDGDRMRYSTSNLPEGSIFYPDHPPSREYCESQDVAYFLWGPLPSQIGTYYPNFRVEDLDENDIPKNSNEHTIEMVVE